MTEKRFTITQDFEEHHRQIRDNGHIIMGCFVEPQAEVIVELLNELHEENTMLKERRHEDINDLSVIAMKYKSLEKENQQLRIKIRKVRLEKIHQNKENEQLKKALWCIRKRYGYTIEEFIEDLKDNGIDLTKVNLE